MKLWELSDEKLDKTCEDFSQVLFDKRAEFFQTHVLCHRVRIPRNAEDKTLGSVVADCVKEVRNLSDLAYRHMYVRLRLSPT